ncbi:protein of unknown function DUF2085 [Lachnospiraceae bacterium KM106-2]|nr:protein of unknown function DUF2085 [Lachnospiraceae bacterium KM106-2]
MLREDDQNIKATKEYQLWTKCMELGEKTGCHQKPERSFYVKGYQMPVCARCVGADIGYAAGLIAYLKFGFDKLKYIAVIGAEIMFFDWYLQAIKVKKSTNIRRLLTGICGGFGICICYLKLISTCIKWIRKIL